ncbi:hypothetical protein LPC08_16360 [Roseomonas sp. OT10]|uniref:hypothetical protein n=1 Tax=Roseomonas cutis TaxID=2897332 RepID=UPI001E4A254A|nr:hypothetical protein [Roseomonas sp. OT10]UFN47581.1 hypothetical protein LPC08_16360 [Roseomonas sp. OT10]
MTGRRRLAAGPFEAWLEEGALRHLRWRGAEVLRGAAYLFRDRDWGTATPEITDLSVETAADAVAVRYRARVALPEGAFAWEARIVLQAGGLCTFVVEGEAEAPVETNRCGLVLLHPAACAGLPLRVTHTDGREEETAFPERISPGQPVLDIRALRYAPVDGLEVACRLEAELPHDPRGRFEMEDQRNWSDASFKTYVGSLLDPWPYRLQPGRRTRQSLELRVSDRRAARPAKPGSGPVPAPRALRAVGPTGERLPAIGLGLPPGAASLAPPARAALAVLQPAWLVGRCEPGAEGQEAELAAVAALARQLGSAVQLEIVPPQGMAPEDALSRAARLCAAAGLAPAAVLPCPAPLLLSHQPGGPWPELPPLEAYYAAARAAFPGARSGGGMLTYFTELNRCRPTGEGIDFVSHATAPIVHAADDLSVMETLEALPHIARSVRALWPGLGYRIGPSSLAMRSNPYGSATVPNEAGRRVPLAARDPRQATFFAAAWTVGYAAALAGAGLEVLSLHATHGPSGVLDAAAKPLPVFRALRILAMAGGAERVALDPLPDGIAALAWAFQGGTMALLANLTGETRTLPLAGRWCQDGGQALGDSLELGPHALNLIREASP